MEHAKNPPQALTGLELRKAIDALCDEFEDAWAKGNSPKIESYLDSLDPASRPAFLRELLVTEMALRRPGDPEASCEHCLARFPQYREVVNELFANWPSERVTEISVRFGARHADLVREVRARLDPNKTESGFFPRAKAVDAVRPMNELWGLLIRRAQISTRNGLHADHDAQVDRLDVVAKRLLNAFPAGRRELLQALMMGTAIADVARQHRVTESKVRATYQAAVSMLAARGSSTRGGDAPTTNQAG